jgi:hypothetical protein
MEGIGLVEIALVAASFVAMEVAINPEVHDASVDGITDTANAIKEYISTSQEDKTNDLIDSYGNSTDNTGGSGDFNGGICPPPWGTVICGIVAADLILAGIHHGGAGDDTSPSKLPNPTQTSTPTLTLTPTQTLMPISTPTLKPTYHLLPYYRWK